MKQEKTIKKWFVMAAAFLFICINCKIVVAADGQVSSFQLYTSDEEQRICDDLNMGCPMYLAKDDQVPSLPLLAHREASKMCTGGKDCEQIRVRLYAYPALKIHRCPDVERCGVFDPTKVYVCAPIDCEIMDGQYDRDRIWDYRRIISRFLDFHSAFGMIYG